LTPLANTQKKCRIANLDVKSLENTPKSFGKTQKSGNLLKIKRILIPTYQLSRGPVFNLACQGGRFAPLPFVSNATDGNQCAGVPSYTYAGFFSRSIKIRSLLEYVYAG